jgi:hypothetical protein
MPFYKMTDITLYDEETSYTLNPKKDLTAYELFLLNKIIKTAEINHAQEAIPHIVKMIKEYELERHFDIIKK